MTKIRQLTAAYPAPAQECRSTVAENRTVCAADTLFQVSSAEWSRAELESLQANVDDRLASLQARSGAICTVREQVFSELYDEVIRQVRLSRAR